MKFNAVANGYKIRYVVFKTVAQKWANFLDRPFYISLVTGANWAEFKRLLCLPYRFIYYATGSYVALNAKFSKGDPDIIHPEGLIGILALILFIKSQSLWNANRQFLSLIKSAPARQPLQKPDQ